MMGKAGLIGPISYQLLEERDEGVVSRVHGSVTLSALPHSGEFVTYLSRSHRLG